MFLYICKIKIFLTKWKTQNVSLSAPGPLATLLECLLIMVGVILDTLQQIESHLLMRHYDGFFDNGMRIKGRSNAMAY